MAGTEEIVLLPDARPLIALAYAGAPDLLHRPGWKVALVDMALHEITRNQTPTSRKIGAWVKRKRPVIIDTKIDRRYGRALAVSSPRKSNLGALAMQEAMQGFAIAARARTGVFLLEDHKIARTSFLLPDNCRKVSTRAFLIFLEENGWIASAAAIECEAIRNGRQFSMLRFPGR